MVVLTCGHSVRQNISITLNLIMGEDENLKAWKAATNLLTDPTEILVKAGKTFKLVGHPLSSNRRIESSEFGVIAIKWPADISKLSRI